METLALFPLDTRVDEGGQLWLGGCRASALAEAFGTPLYVFDEATLRARCRLYQQALARHYPGSAQVAYASKAYLNLALAQLFAQEGLSLDVVSGGELYLALQAEFPPERIHLHGNNKSPAELALALDEGVGRIVVDNLHELGCLERLAAERRVRAAIWLRLSPGVDVHTHAYRKTGLLESKFGLALVTGDAERAVGRALSSPHLALLGLHVHIGSQIFDLAPLMEAIDLVLDFAADIGAQRGLELREFSPGGGWGVPYHEADPAAPVEDYVQGLGQAVAAGCRRHRLPLPELVLEPGRSIVAPAAVVLYRVGARKEIPGVRTYVAVDGGLADNIRPALYGARYTALAATQAHRPAQEQVSLVGKFCESGDVLIRGIRLPRLAAGDLLAIPVAGAYALPMASNYNLAPRPGVVLVRDGQAQVIQRRECFDDLIARDGPLPNWGEIDGANRACFEETVCTT